MTDTTLTASRLWKRMTADQRLRAARALWADKEAAGDKQQAAQLIAKHMKFRPKSVSGLDADRKARYLTAVPEVPEELAAHLLIMFHLAEQRPMMGTFLDALGIKHDDGMIDEEHVTPDPTKFGAAKAAITAAYPAEDVALYLDTLQWQDPASWGALGESSG